MFKTVLKLHYVIPLSFTEWLSCPFRLGNSVKAGRGQKCVMFEDQKVTEFLTSSFPGTKMTRVQCFLFVLQDTKGKCLLVWSLASTAGPLKEESCSFRSLGVGLRHELLQGNLCKINKWLLWLGFLVFLPPRLGSSAPAIKMFPDMKLYLEVISSGFKKCSVMMVSCKHSF